MGLQRTKLRFWVLRMRRRIRRKPSHIRARLRHWWAFGGDAEQSPHHYTIWGGVIAVLLTGAAILFTTTTDTVFRGIGIACLLPPSMSFLASSCRFRSQGPATQRLVRARREAARRAVVDELSRDKERGDA